MRLTVPITGTVSVEGSAFGDGKLEGDPSDPIRLIDIDLGNVSWTMVDIDIENEVMIIEVEPAKTVPEDTGQVDGDGDPIFNMRAATAQEKAGFLNQARGLVEGKSKAELLSMSKSARLKRPQV